MKFQSNRHLPVATILTSSLLGITTLSYISLTILGAFAIDSAVDDISITVPSSCSLTSTLDSAHTETINIGTNVDDIGTTTIKVFCNDSEGFAIYAAGYTGDEIGGTNSNKLIGTNNQTSIGNIDTGIATSGATSNWSMKLIKVENEQGEDPVAYNPANLTIESDTNGSFANYHVVPNEYTKVASFTSTTDATLGSVLQTTYQAYISPTQAAGTYAGKVKYVLVHPANTDPPVEYNQIGIFYHGNGQTFANGLTENYVVYGRNSCVPMYIADSPTIIKSSNLNSDGTQNGSYANNYEEGETWAGEEIEEVKQFDNASYVRVVVDYAITADSAYLYVYEGNWGEEIGKISTYDEVSDEEHDINGTKTFLVAGDTVSIYASLDSWKEDDVIVAPKSNYDYGFFIKVYPIYESEQSSTEETSICSYGTVTGAYAETTTWKDSWYAIVNGEKIFFRNEADVMNYIEDNEDKLLGTTTHLFASPYTYALFEKGWNIGHKLKSLAMGDDDVGTYTPSSEIKSIQMANALPSGFVADFNNTITLSNSPYPAYIWYDNANDAGVLYIYTAAEKVLLHADSANLFSANIALSDISGLANWDVSNVTEMYQLFSQCTSLTNLSPLANWDVSNVTSMEGTFSGLTSLTDLSPLANWNVSNVTVMDNTFSDLASLTDLSPLANWNVSNVVVMDGVFRGLTSLTDLSPLANWDISSLRTVMNLFIDCTSLTDLSPLANWDVSNIKTMTAMFWGLTSLTDLSPLANWDFSNMEELRTMFYGCTSLADLSPLAGWDIGNIRDMSSMFNGCTSLTDLSPLANWDTSGLEDMHSMFDGCTSLTDLSPLAGWDTGNIRNMSSMFYRCTSLTDLSPLAGWDTGNVERMGYMFWNCASLSDISPLAGWDTRNVKNMDRMFAYCGRLRDSSSINDWEIGNVESFDRMFLSTPSHPTFTKRNGTWDSNGTFTPSF